MYLCGLKMKRIFLISILLFFLGTVYADGPRYRFKSRRALQSLWRKEAMENPMSSDRNSRSRQLSSRELRGEDTEELTDGSHAYGVVVSSNPFENNNVTSSVDPFYTSGGGSRGKGDVPFIPAHTDDGPHIVTTDDPTGFITGGGTASNPSGQGYIAPPKPPVGEGLHILLILSAALIAIKKRLSN